MILARRLAKLIGSGIGLIEIGRSIDMTAGLIDRRRVPCTPEAIFEVREMLEGRLIDYWGGK